MIKIVMDSAGDLPDEWIERYDIEVIPINVHMGEHTFLEGIDLTPDFFYDWIQKTGLIPKSSQPTPEQYKSLYREIAEPGDVVLSIHLTSKLSGTFESAQIAARELEEEAFNVIPFDTMSGTGIQGYMCCEARVMDRQGASVEDILQRLAYIRDHHEVIFALDTLEFAHISGRVNQIESLFASLLQIKPIIYLKNGTLEVLKKVRTRTSSLDFILQEVGRRLNTQLVNAAVMHAHDLVTANAFAEKVRARLNIKNIFIEEVSTGIAANLGPGTIGIVAYPAGEGAL